MNIKNIQYFLFNKQYINFIKYKLYFIKLFHSKCINSYYAGFLKQE